MLRGLLRVSRRFCSLSGQRPSSETLETDLVYEFLPAQRVPGFATAEGTKRYAARNPRVSPDNFRSPFHDPEMRLSRLGYGSYVGDPTKEHDVQMLSALLRCVESGGVNVIDTAINYRYMKSERVVGEAVRRLQKRGIGRDELFVCTKGGFLTKDADRPEFAESQLTRLLNRGEVGPQDLVGNAHCMHPAFLEAQLEQSLENLGLETVDLFYVHNPAEAQLALIGEEQFYLRLARAFEMLEKKRAEGRLRHFGLATWNCFRSPPEEAGVHVSLERVVGEAERVGGRDHGLRFVQTPLNGLMVEAFAMEWQNVSSAVFARDNEMIARKFGVDPAKLKQAAPGPETPTGFLRAARIFGVNVMTSSSLMQGAVLKHPMDKAVFDCDSNAARHLLFIRSIPDTAIISNLVGMKAEPSVAQDLEVTLRNNLTPEAFFRYIKSFGAASQ